MLIRFSAWISALALFTGLTVAKPDPDIFDGSAFPIPEASARELIAQLMEDLLREAETAGQVVSLEANGAAGGAEDNGEEGGGGAESSPPASTGSSPTQVAGTGEASPAGTPRRTEPVTIGNPDLAIQRDPNAVGGQLGDPIQRTNTRGGVAGSGPDRSRTPTGSASGGALPTDL
jgi:hypothetical protein